MRKLALIAAALAIGAPAAAQQMRYPATFYVGPYPYDFYITQTGPLDFYVEYTANRKLTDYWCAAGYYVTQYMHAGDLARVYRASYPPQKAGQGISFTLDPAGSVGDTGLTTYGGEQDGGMNANGAYGAFCFDWDPLDP